MHVSREKKRTDTRKIYRTHGTTPACEECDKVYMYNTSASKKSESKVKRGMRLGLAAGERVSEIRKEERTIGMNTEAVTQ